MERYTSWGASGAWRVPRWWLPYFLLVLGGTENRNDVSGQWYNEWQPNPWVDSPIFRSLRMTFLPMLAKGPAEYPKPDEDEASNEEPLYKPERTKSSLPRAPSPHKALLLGPLAGEVRYMKWWLTKFIADYLDIFHMYSEMGNDERTAMQLKFHYSRNPSVFLTTPKVGGTGRNLTTANHAVITQKFWVMNKQRQSFARVVQLGQNSLPHTWLLHARSNCYNNRASDLHQHSGVAQMRVQHGLISQWNIMTMMIDQILECLQVHMMQLTVDGDWVLSEGENEW